MSGRTVSMHQMHPLPARVQSERAVPFSEYSLGTFERDKDGVPRLKKFPNPFVDVFTVVETN